MDAYIQEKIKRNTQHFVADRIAKFVSDAVEITQYRDPELSGTYFHGKLKLQSELIAKARESLQSPLKFAWDQNSELKMKNDLLEFDLQKINIGIKKAKKKYHNNTKNKSARVNIQRIKRVINAND